MDKEEQEMGKGVAAPADPVAKRPFFIWYGKRRFLQVRSRMAGEYSFCTRIMAGLRTAPE